MTEAAVTPRDPKWLLDQRATLSELSLTAVCLIDSLLWEDNVSDLNVLSQAQLVAWSDNLNMFFS